MLEFEEYSIEKSSQKVGFIKLTLIWVNDTNGAIETMPRLTIS